ncbi:hypothetical protein HMPREF1988_01718, partial [Porphyromonas gingivalis F0185]
MRLVPLFFLTPFSFPCTLYSRPTANISVKKSFLCEGKNIFSFLFVCGLFNCSYAREHIIYMLPFVFFLGRESFSSGAVFLSNRLKKILKDLSVKKKGV